MSFYKRCRSQCLKDLTYPNIPSLQQSTTVGTNTKTVQNVDASADIWVEQSRNQHSQNSAYNREGDMLRRE